MQCGIGGIEPLLNLVVYLSDNTRIILCDVKDYGRGYLVLAKALRHLLWSRDASERLCEHGLLEVTIVVSHGVYDVSKDVHVLGCLHGKLVKLLVLILQILQVLVEHVIETSVISCLVGKPCGNGDIRRVLVRLLNLVQPFH